MIAQKSNQLDTKSNFLESELNLLDLFTKATEGSILFGCGNPRSILFNDEEYIDNNSTVYFLFDEKGKLITNKSKYEDAGFLGKISKYYNNNELLKIEIFSKSNDGLL